MNSKIFAQHRGDTPVPSSAEKVRPDHALFGLTLSVADLAASPALALLKERVRRLQTDIPAAAPGSSVDVQDFDAPSIPALLSKSTEETAARLSLTVTVPLDTAAPFFARAERVAAVDDVLRQLVIEGRKSKPNFNVSRQLPTFLVNDDAVDAGRVRLLARWQSRLQELTAFASVSVDGVWSTAEVTQRSVSIEEVELRCELGGVATLRLPRQRLAT